MASRPRTEKGDVQVIVVSSVRPLLRGVVCALEMDRVAIALDSDVEVPITEIQVEAEVVRVELECALDVRHEELLWPYSGLLVSLTSCAARLCRPTSVQRESDDRACRGAARLGSPATPPQPKASYPVSAAVTRSMTISSSPSFSA